MDASMSSYGRKYEVGDVVRGQGSGSLYAITDPVTDTNGCIGAIILDARLGLLDMNLRDGDPYRPHADAVTKEEFLSIAYKSKGHPHADGTDKDQASQAG